jgi:hypothetical protein
MRFFSKAKDGGPASPVDAYFLFEIKWLGSVALLKFNKGGRGAFHTHAFNALTWFIKGDIIEQTLETEPGAAITAYSSRAYTRSLLPKFTPRTQCHRVFAHKTSWVFTIRGPWAKRWTEVSPQGELTTFESGRKVVGN